MSSTSRFVYVWEFEVAQGCNAQFLQAYGPSGTWAKLFGRATGYVGTLLLQDHANPARFLTIDRWSTAQAFDPFRAQFGAEYAELDRSCEAFTSRESSLGSYWEVL